MVYDSVLDDRSPALNRSETIAREIIRDDPSKPWFFRHPSLSPKEQYVLVYRGVGAQQEKISTDHIGYWWTVNPYYSIPKSRGKGTFFVALVKVIDLENSAKDVSIDEYPNYGFEEDPSGARLASDIEFDLLHNRTVLSRASKLPGGTFLKTPENFSQIGQEIFLPSFIKPTPKQ